MGEHTPQTPLDVLKAARELISEPKRWTQGYYARDDYGNLVSPIMPNAACFCSLGAISKVLGTLGAFMTVRGERAADALNDTLRAMRRPPKVWVWQDDPHRTHAEVLDLFDRTIARLEAEAAHD